MESGGFTEKLYATRSQERKSGRSDKAGKSDKPPCPLCGKPMLLRTARKGPKAGESFWGCSGYPDCRSTRQAGLTKKSDQSDGSDKHLKKTP